ncbi:MAG: helix-turn-helix domain-containing protein [Chloroflexota bacterium]
MGTDPLDQVLTLLEAARELDIHPDSLRKLANRGAVPGARKWAKRWVFDRSELRRFKGTYRNLPGRPPGVAVR